MQKPARLDVSFDNVVSWSGTKQWARELAI